MLILGFAKTTLLDYPEHVAATIFTGGCNFRCPFCHNGQMVMNPSSMPRIAEEEVISHLIKRKNVLDGVCITGGEPTLQADLTDFIVRIKDMGYKVKLDTNGSHPELLRELIDKKFIDYVAMDIKNCRQKYAITAGCSDSLVSKVYESVDILKEGKIDYEFRTTVVRELHSREDMICLAKEIAGASKYYIQSYVDSDNVIERKYTSYSKEELTDIAKCISFVNPHLRGID